MRVKLKIPNFFHFKTLMKVRVTDLNYGQHMGNDVFLTFAHESRVRYFKTIEMTERNFFGFSLIMADSVVKYKSQAFLGDEICIKISVVNCTSHGFQLFYLLKNNHTKIDVAYIQTSMVFYNYEKEKIMPFPKKFKNYLENQKLK